MNEQPNHNKYQNGIVLQLNSTNTANGIKLHCWNNHQYQDFLLQKFPFLRWLCSNPSFCRKRALASGMVTQQRLRCFGDLAPRNAPTPLISILGKWHLFQSFPSQHIRKHVCCNGVLPVRGILPLGCQSCKKAIPSWFLDIPIDGKKIDGCLRY